MDYKTTLALLVVVVVGIGTFLIWNPEPPAGDSGDAEPQTTRDLFDPKPDTEIVRMELEQPGKERVVFTRAEKQDTPGEYADWRLAEPVAGKAVNWTVKSFAEKVRDLKYRDRDSTITDETAARNYAEELNDATKAAHGLPLDEPNATATVLAIPEGTPVVMFQVRRSDGLRAFRFSEVNAVEYTCVTP